MGVADSRARWGKRQEASGGCGGAQALVSTAQFVDQRSGLRTDPFGGDSDGFIEALPKPSETQRSSSGDCGPQLRPLEADHKIAAPSLVEPQNAPDAMMRVNQSADGSTTVSSGVRGHHVGLDI